MTTRPRGRPRAYNPEIALESALNAFWKGGYSGTSMDTLSEATGLNRPSLYAGLGDKHTIYIKAMRHFQDYVRQRFDAALAPLANDRSFSDVLLRYLRSARDLYGINESTGVGGCAVISTATAEALTDPEIRQVLDDALGEMEAQLLSRLKQAKDCGELAEDVDLETLCFLVTSTAHSIGIRARAGQPRQDIERVVDSLVRAFLPSS